MAELSYCNVTGKKQRIIELSILNNSFSEKVKKLISSMHITYVCVCVCTCVNFSEQSEMVGFPPVVDLTRSDLE